MRIRLYDGKYKRWFRGYMGSNVSAESAAVSKEESVRKQMELVIYSLKDNYC